MPEMDRYEVIASNEISEVRTFTLGGFPQKVAIEGKTKDLPVLLILHGGPGACLPYCVGSRGMNKEITDKYIMVKWDQLGCGANYRKIDNSFTIDSFVRMTQDLVTELKQMFPGNKIILFSVSWGSVLSAKLLEKDPHAVDAVVNWGQIVKDMFFNEEVMTALEKSELPRKKLEKFRSVTHETQTLKDQFRVSQAIRKYTDGYIRKDAPKSDMGPFLKELKNGPDYTFKDYIHTRINGFLTNKSIWNEIIHLDLTEILKNVRIPYILYQGERDIVTSTSMVEALVGSCNNPNLNLHIVSNEGHIPSMDMKDVILAEKPFF